MQIDNSKWIEMVATESTRRIDVSVCKSVFGSFFQFSFFVSSSLIVFGMKRKFGSMYSTKKTVRSWKRYKIRQRKIYFVCIVMWLCETLDHIGCAEEDVLIRCFWKTFFVLMHIFTIFGLNVFAFQHWVCLAMFQIVPCWTSSECINYAVYLLRIVHIFIQYACIV